MRVDFAKLASVPAQERHGIPVDYRLLDPAAIEPFTDYMTVWSAPLDEDFVLPDIPESLTPGTPRRSLFQRVVEYPKAFACKMRDVLSYYPEVFEVPEVPELDWPQQSDVADGLSGNEFDNVEMLDEKSDTESVGSILRSFWFVTPDESWIEEQELDEVLAGYSELSLDATVTFDIPAKTKPQSYTKWLFGGLKADFVKCFDHACPGFPSRKLVCAAVSAVGVICLGIVFSNILM